MNILSQLVSIEATIKNKKITKIRGFTELSVNLTENKEKGKLEVLQLKINPKLLIHSPHKRISNTLIEVQVTSGSISSSKDNSKDSNTVDTNDNNITSLVRIEFSLQFTFNSNSQLILYNYFPHTKERIPFQLHFIIPVEYDLITLGELQKQSVAYAKNGWKIVCYDTTGFLCCGKDVYVVFGKFLVQSFRNFVVFAEKSDDREEGDILTIDKEYLNVLNKINEFYTSYIGTNFPFSSLKIIFTHSYSIPPPLHFTSILSKPSLLLINYPLNSTNKQLIDEVFEFRIRLSLGIALQWFSEFVYEKGEGDLWVVYGLGCYLSGLFVRKHFGVNEYKFRLKKDMEKCIQQDINNQPLHLLTRTNLDFLCLKSGLVMYMLEKYLGRNIMQKCVNRIVVCGISGEFSSGISTNWFLKLCRKLSGKDVFLFVNQWVYESGIPRFEIRFSLNRKRNVIELKLNQLGDSSTTNNTTNTNEGGLSAKRIYVGPLCVRVHEPDGTFDHVVSVEEESHMFDLPYHTKYKRVRHNKKTQMLEMKLALEEAEREIQEGLMPPAGTEVDEEVCKRDPVIANEIAKGDWKPMDAEGNLLNAPISWIRIDPEMDLVVDLSRFEQSDYMDSQQVLKDKCVVAQYEVIKRVGEKYSGGSGEQAEGPEKSELVLNCLFGVLMNVRCFYRVRMEAAMALAKSTMGTSVANNETGQVILQNNALTTINSILKTNAPIGKKFLMLAFKRKYCVFPFDDSVDMVPKRNDFSVFTEYFVQKGIVEAFGFVTSPSANQPGVKEVDEGCLRLLVNLLKLNDNSSNKFSDHQYVSCLIDGIGFGFYNLANENFVDIISGESDNEDGSWLNLSKKALFEDALKEVERQLFLETQVPSFRNSVALSCLAVLQKWMACGLIKVDLRPFILFSRPGNFVEIRKRCVDSLILLGLGDSGRSHDNSPFSEELVLYLFEMIQSGENDLILHLCKRLSCFLVVLGLTYKKNKEIEFNNGQGLNQPEKKLNVQVENLESGLSQQVSTLRKAPVNAIQKIRDLILRNKDIQAILASLVASADNYEDELKAAILELNQVIHDEKDREGPKIKILLKSLTSLNNITIAGDRVTESTSNLSKEEDIDVVSNSVSSVPKPEERPIKKIKIKFSGGAPVIVGNDDKAATQSVSSAVQENEVVDLTEKNQKQITADQKVNVKEKSDKIIHEKIQKEVSQVNTQVYHNNVPAPDPIETVQKTKAENLESPKAKKPKITLKLNLKLAQNK